MKSNKVVIVTGCNSPKGIGFAIVHYLAGRGYIVYATVRNEESSIDLRKSIKSNETILIKYLDVIQETMIVNVVQDIMKEQGKIDVLVNNAGYGLIGAVEEITIEQAKFEYDVNVFGAVRLTHEVLPHMREIKSGHIINISSIFVSGLSLPMCGFYVGTKAALEKISESLAIEVAPWNIAVTNFQPGPVTTNLSKKFGSRLAPDDNPYKKHLAKMRQYLNEELFYETPQDTARAVGCIIATKKPPLMTQSTDKARQYVSKFRHDIADNGEFDKMIALFKY